MAYTFQVDGRHQATLWTDTTLRPLYTVTARTAKTVTVARLVRDEPQTPRRVKIHTSTLGHEFCYPEGNFVHNPVLTAYPA